MHLSIHVTRVPRCTCLPVNEDWHASMKIFKGFRVLSPRNPSIRINLEGAWKEDCIMDLTETSPKIPCGLASGNPCQLLAAPPCLALTQSSSPCSYLGLFPVWPKGQLG